MCNACKSIATPSTKLPSDTDTTTDAEAFAQHMLGTLNNAMLGVMISVGHRTHLFDTMRGLDWVTSHELAAAADLNERYVREWLGAMATGQIVDVDGSGETERFHLPEAHAAVLCRDGEAMGTVFQWLEVVAEVETKVVEAFKHGGGVPYEAYRRFHEVMAEESNLSVVSGLHEHILPLAPGLSEQLDAGINVLDIGCGSGLAICELAKRYPRSRFTGYDLSEEAITKARRTALAHGLPNVTFAVRDVSQLDNENAFDLVTGFDVIHDQRDPAGVLQTVRRALRPGATFLMQDLRCHSRVADNVGHPLCPLLYAMSTMHCMTVSLAQGGAGLGAAWGEELAVEMLTDAGFEGLSVNQLPHDIQNNWYVMRKPAA